MGRIARRSGTASRALVGLLLLGLVALSPVRADNEPPADGEAAPDGEAAANGLAFAEDLPRLDDTERMPEPGEPVRLTLRMAIDPAVAQQHLESAVRRSRSRPDAFTQHGPGGADGGLLDNLDNFAYRYWYTRGPLTVRPIAEGLRVQTQARVQLDVRCRLVQRAPLIERHLRDRRVNLGLDLAVGVDEEWNVTVASRGLRVEILDPVTIDIPIPGRNPIVLADVTHVAERELRHVLSSQLDGLLAALRRSVDVRTAVEQAWQRVLAAPHAVPLQASDSDRDADREAAGNRVAGEGDGEGPADDAAAGRSADATPDGGSTARPDAATVLLRPSSAAVGPVRGADGRLLLDIQVTCQPLLALAEVAYEPPVLPGNGELQADDSGRFRLLGEVLMPLERVSRQLEQAITADAANAADPAYESRWRFELRNIWVQVRHARVTADGDELVVLLLVDSNLHPGAPARLGLIGRPELGEDGTTLSLPNLRLTERTAEWWERRYRFLPAAPLVAKVREGAVVDLRRELSGLRQRVDAFLTRTHVLSEALQVRCEGAVEEPARLRGAVVREAPGEATAYDEHDPRRLLAGGRVESASLYIELVGRLTAYVEPR